MKLQQKAPSRKGFTLIEMTAALVLSMGIAIALLALLQQQISFTRALNDFKFLRDEAPQINTLLTNIINKSDNYRIYNDLDSAKNLTSAVRSDGKSLRLRYRNPDGTYDQAIVSFETRGGQKQLNYYHRGKNASNWRSQPSWTISTKPDSVDFDNSTGILLVTLTGAKGDEISYAGNPD
tara:strand:- start:297 stop:833 length:537 start_codon:yes stop_codon:yes gene_type:complete